MMTKAEAQQIVRMIESHYQADFGRDGRVLWTTELLEYDPDIAVRAVAAMTKVPLPHNRSRPLLSDYRPLYLKLARDAAVMTAHPALPVSPTRQPPWVRRWERARAAGDLRPFPEQAPGYEELRRVHPHNVAAYALPHVSHSSREDWVQPDEYVEDISDV